MAVEFEPPPAGDMIFMMFLSEEENKIAQVMHHAYLVTKTLYGGLNGYADNWKVKKNGIWYDLLFKKQVHEYIIDSNSTEQKIELFLKTLDRLKLPKGSIQSGKVYSPEEVMSKLLELGKKDPSIYYGSPESQFDKVRKAFPQPTRY